MPPPRRYRKDAAKTFRVGLLVPSSNTVMEVDLYRNLPPPITLHPARMYLEETTPQGEERMISEELPRPPGALSEGFMWKSR